MTGVNRGDIVLEVRLADGKRGQAALWSHREYRQSSSGSQVPTSRMSATSATTSSELMIKTEGLEETRRIPSAAESQRRQRQRFSAPTHYGE